ncbi:MAG: prephenate dehydrogenase/arogenate dehydrogenase family protein [Bacillota bacterium]|nr:prephenate dehydrogenase/arogenate dehydrogenase family protein [Bacillota bacterium]
MAVPCSKPLFKKCCIIGLGLMGGSLGMALGKYNVVEERWGHDINALSMAEARERGAVDKTGDLSSSLDDAELVILSMPVGQIVEMLSEISSFLKKGALVTDLGSTKLRIVETMENVLPPGVTGIGGHPMAGSEQAGIAVADPSMLENAIYILTPTWHTSGRKLRKLQDMIHAVGARPLILEPEEHDRFAALISHFPQMVAVALVNTLRNSGQDQDLLLTLAGNGFKDTTRIAMSEPSMWYDIFTTNKKYLRDSLEIFLEELHSLHGYLEKEDEKEAKETLTKAGFVRRSLQ